MSRYSTYKKLILEDKRSVKFNFTDSNKIHYVYRITEIETNKHYYGSRTQNRVDILEDFWSYCTSSKRKSIIKNKKSNSLLIQIFDSNNELKFTSDMKFEDFCSQHNLSFRVFKKSYQDNGGRLYEKKRS